MRSKLTCGLAAAIWIASANAVAAPTAAGGYLPGMPISPMCPAVAPGPPDMAHDRFAFVSHGEVASIFIDLDRIGCENYLVQVLYLQVLNPVASSTPQGRVVERRVDFDCFMNMAVERGGTWRDTRGGSSPNTTVGRMEVRPSTVNQVLRAYVCGKPEAKPIGQIYLGEEAAITAGVKILKDALAAKAAAAKAKPKS